MTDRATSEAAAVSTAPRAAGHSGRIMRFLVAGLANTAFGYAVYALMVLLGLHPQGALAVQFALGVVWNYSLHGRLVFGIRGYGRMPQYALAYVAVYLFNAALLHLLVQAGLGPYVAQALALGPTVVLSYVVVSLALGVPLRNTGESS